MQAEEYLGDQACASCHEAIVKDHGATHHAGTFRAVSADKEGSLFRSGQVVTDGKRGIRYSPLLEGGKCYIVGDNGQEKGRLSADYILGSAANGHTFFSFREPDRWLELRTSYYPGLKRWDFTPNQGENDNISAPAGIVFPAKSMGECLRCHVTTLYGTEAAWDPARSKLGIGCERCHGPGRAHVEAVRSAGKNLAGIDLKMENFRTAPAARVEALCADCHKETSPTPQGEKHIEEELPRLQAVALERSACYIKSGALSCTTCHSPHTNVSKQTTRYNEACLRCHAGALPETPVHRLKPIAGAFNRPECKVKPRGDCVSCHMPRKSIPILSVQSTHHWIKVWKQDRS